MFDPWGASCSHRFPCLLSFEKCQQNLQNHPFSLLHSFPTPCSSVLTYVLFHLLIYDLTSTQCTHSGVWKTLCSYSMESLSFSECTQFTLLFMSSAFNLYFNLTCSEEGGTEIHLPQISTNLLLILPAHGLALILYNFSLFAVFYTSSSGANPVSQQKFTHQLYAVVNLISAELCQTRRLLIKKD